MQNRKTNLINTAYSALFTALICVFAQITVPMPSGIPITLQTFAVALCGYILGYKLAPASVAAYILLGAVGIPVFSGFRGGIQVIFSLTGGFIFGFLFLAFFCGLAKSAKHSVLKIIYSVLGLIMCHFFGVLQLAFISKTSFISCFLTASLPFLIKDLLSLAAAFLIAVLLNKRLHI